MFWSSIMNFELLMCCFLQSLCEGDFLLCVQVYDELCAWFHVMDHSRYAQWLPVHVQDMVQLSERYPLVYAEFVKGNCIVQESSHKFRLIGKDQSHEQSNRSLQVHGGAAGLEENLEVLTLFMLAGPDCSHCIEEFETVLDTPSSITTAHHERAHWMQVKYKADVLSFVEITENLYNPFDNEHQFVALHTQEIIAQEVEASLTQLHEVVK